MTRAPIFFVFWAATALAQAPATLPPVVLVLVAVLAALLPARRAIHISPVRSLKGD